METLEARALMSLSGNQLFPADNPWNQPIAAAPVAANSAALVASVGSGRGLHADFGAGTYEGGRIGIPFVVVPGNQPKVSVVIDAYPAESDRVPVPIPAGAAIEGDPLPAGDNAGDRHLIVYDKDNNVGYELFNARRPTETSDGKWHADAEAVWDYSRNSFRTPGDTSADAAGLPILPGLVRPDEVLDQRAITHALRITVPRTANVYVYPASHVAGSGNPATTPRLGERFRLRADFDLSGYSAANRVILQALKDYGAIVADNGSGWYVSGEPSDRWDNDDLHNLGRVLGGNLEAVDLTPRVTGLAAASGPAAGGQTVAVLGSGFGGGAGRTQVLFAGVAATGVTVASDGRITCVAPPHAAGRVDVVVRSPYGPSANTAADDYTYVQPMAPVVATAVVGGGSAQRSRVGELTVSFDRAVTLDAGAVTLARPGGSAVGLTVTNPAGDGRTYVVRFAGVDPARGSLADGVYDLRVSAASVHAGGGSAMPADYTAKFHRLFGDADGDGDSDNSDLFQFRSSYGRSAGDPAYRAEFDFDADGDADNADLFQVRSRRSVEYKGY